jgi:hypothetical protein
MHDDDSGLSGRRLSREVFEERFTDESGDVLPSRMVRERSESWEGVNETLESSAQVSLGCGHFHRFGQPVARCEICSRKAGRTLCVCMKCHVLCLVCGISVCRRHSRPGADGQRYCSRRCLRRGRKLGLATLAPSHVPARAPTAPVGSPVPLQPLLNRESSVSRFVKRLFEWW